MNFKEDSFGVNISGYINKQFGLGEGVRANIRAIKTTEIPYVLNDFNIDISKHIKDCTDGTQKISAENPYSINLVQVNIDKLLGLIGETDRKYFLGKYNIAFWAWELETFPEESKVYFDLFDEIWVPSNFCTEAISKVSPVPVLKFMHSIEIEKPTLSRRELNLPEDKFLFLTMFDYYSSIDRKNPIATIEAYEKAFGKNNPDVILVIKSSLSNEFPKEKQILISKIGNNKSIILIEEILEKNELYSLMNCCDCFVSLHRSEGFGLTMAESMYLGKPVIATAYSANNEFMTINNSFLVKYKLVSAKDMYYFSTAKDFWADPDTNHAAELMKEVMQNLEYAQMIAEQGKKDVHHLLSPKLIGEKIANRLKFINIHLHSKSNEMKSSEDGLLLLENKLLQKKIEKLRSYFPIQLKLWFKDFQNKLTGKKRKYMWED
ncbi:glycosyltransferase [Chryseobacterium suipulveris]|uniref:Glycosyltransferase n=1 Tax=Chryseobacterium suipulveris TaxID=2929800 RepID=A0ABY4BVI4_9FLAO|nr:glycosyltransferase [Chryseobacterium suipulveris]UOE40555.1 glycosyltransferase [Chryseobacterium suipulveris]